MHVTLALPLYGPYNLFSGSRFGAVDLRHPIATVIPGVNGVVLGVLAATFEPLTGSEIARLSGGRVSQSSVSRVLPEMVQLGIVAAQPAGRAILYRLNRDHVAAGAILRAASLRDELFARMTAATTAWAIEPVAVWVFGSAARDAGSSDSDIDVIVVRDEQIDADDPLWNEQLTGLAGWVQSWSGNGCDLLEYTPSELWALVAAGDALVQALLNDAITLAGERPSVLLRRVG